MKPVSATAIARCPTSLVDGLKLAYVQRKGISRMNELALGTRVERYEVQSILGRGGMAVVALAKHVELGSLHALKVLHVTRPGVVQRMMQEGRVQATIDHPNVVGVRDVIQVHGLPCLVMEYVDGPSLNGVLHTFALNYQQLDAIAYDLMNGLAAAHARTLVHRDLKPQNILLQIGVDRVVCKIVDFGLAKVRDTSSEGLGRYRTQSGQMMGTPSYMAPEQFNDAKTVDHRADIFALAAVLYEALTGEPPFGTDALTEIYARSALGKFTPIETSRPNVPPRIRAAIEAGLQPKPQDRPASIAEFRKLWQGNAPLPTHAWSKQDLTEMAAIRDAEHSLSAEDDGSLFPEGSPHARGAENTLNHGSLTILDPNNIRTMIGLAALTAVVAIVVGAVFGATLCWMNNPASTATESTLPPVEQPVVP